MPAPKEAVEWRGHHMIDRDGEKIGRIEEIFLDAETETPEWALVEMGLLGTRSAFVPLEGAALEGNRDRGVRVQVPHEKSVVEEAPNLGRGELSPEQEEELYRYYGLEYSPLLETGGAPFEQGLAREDADAPAGGRGAPAAAAPGVSAADMGEKSEGSELAPEDPGAGIYARDPEVRDPEPAGGAGAAEPGMRGPGPPEPGAPDVSEREVVGPSGFEPQTAEPEMVEPGVPEPATAEPRGPEGEPAVVEADATEARPVPPEPPGPAAQRGRGTRRLKRYVVVEVTQEVAGGEPDEIRVEGHLASEPPPGPEEDRSSRSVERPEEGRLGG